MSVRLTASSYLALRASTSPLETRQSLQEFPFPNCLGDYTYCGRVERPLYLLVSFCAPAIFPQEEDEEEEDEEEEEEEHRCVWHRRSSATVTW